jgi:uncharacterized repeat protein (TIGR01451 family)
LPNTGTDTGINSSISIPIPAGLTYVPGSLQILNGSDPGSKTDAIGDDEAEYNPTTQTITIRVGSGANGTMGGSVPPNGTPPHVQFEVAVAPSTNGTTIKVSGVVTSQGLVGSMQGIPPGTWNTGSIVTPTAGPNAGTPTFYPNAPLTLPIRGCLTNLDCPLSMPLCNTTASMCTGSCQSGTDCLGTAVGQVCTPSNVCGCNQDGDCLSGSCNTANNQCQIPTADLSINVTTSPNPPQPTQPVTHTITVTNSGPDTAPQGVTVVYTVPPGGTIQSINPGQGWKCNQVARTITCVDSNPIPAASNAPPIQIVVTPDPTLPTVDIDTTVKSPGSNDPNPSNNTVIRSDTLGGPAQPIDELAGGGYSCDMRGNRATGAHGAALFMLLAVMALGLRRRRLYTKP